MSKTQEKIVFLTPEEFDKKYNGLSVYIDKSFYSGSNTKTVVLAKKDFYHCLDFHKTGPLQISKEVLLKYPNFEKDLLDSAPYYLAHAKNSTKNFFPFKAATPKVIKPFLVKAEQVKAACRENDPCVYAYRKPAYDFKIEAEIINVLIEVSLNCGVDSFQTQHESYDGNEVLSRVIVNFKTSATSGCYEICLLERSTGFIKLAMKFIEDSNNLLF